MAVINFFGVSKAHWILFRNASTGTTGLGKRFDKIEPRQDWGKITSTCHSFTDRLALIFIGERLTLPRRPMGACRLGICQKTYSR